MFLFEIFENISHWNTPSFMKWFGNSKVVDAEGNPLRVYHGTRSMDFDIFRKSRKRDIHPMFQAFNADKHIGIFFTDNPDAADYFAGFPGEGGQRIIPVYLSLQNPLIVDNEGHYKSTRQMILWAKEAKTGGYDGIIIKNIRDAGTVKTPQTVYIAFRANQIKSSVGNVGTYDSKKKSITT